MKVVLSLVALAATASAFTVVPATPRATAFSSVTSATAVYSATSYVILLFWKSVLFRGGEVALTLVNRNGWELGIYRL